MTDREEIIPHFTRTLIKEIELYELSDNGWKIDTLFIGGGTPTILGSRNLESILQALSTKFDLSNVVEFSIETNPGEVSLQTLQDLQTLGINRLSIGVQSFNDRYLTFLTRIHNREQALDTIQHAKSIGFENINIDLIYGIPNQSADDWQMDLETALEHDVRHVSAYALTVESGTPLFKMVSSHQVRMLDDDNIADLFYRTHDFFNSNGYHGYELSNFSQSGLECQHNLHYWHIHPYLAFGPSAHGFDGKTRWNNIPSLSSYMKAIEHGNRPVQNAYTIDEREYANELIGFGLRLKDGFCPDDVPKSLRLACMNKFDEVQLHYRDCLVYNEHHISLTRRGLLFADAIAADFILD